MIQRFEFQLRYPDSATVWAVLQGAGGRLGDGCVGSCSPSTPERLRVTLRHLLSFALRDERAGTLRRVFDHLDLAKRIVIIDAEVLAARAVGDGGRVVDTLTAVRESEVAA